MGVHYQMATGSGSSWSGYFQTSLPTVFGSSVICQCPEPYRQGFSCRRQTWCKHHRSSDLDDCTGGRVGYPIPFLNRATLLLGVLPLTYLVLLVVAVRVCCPLGGGCRTVCVDESSDDHFRGRCARHVSSLLVGTRAPGRSGCGDLLGLRSTRAAPS